MNWGLHAQDSKQELKDWRKILGQAAQECRTFDK